MSLMEMYVTDSLYLNAKKVSEVEHHIPDSSETVLQAQYEISLSNGKKIIVTKNAKYGSGVDDDFWLWKVDGQFFCQDAHALDYLKRIVVEKLTGKRVILTHKRSVPDICLGRCRHPVECNRALCGHCPVAEAFYAAQDGVELIYALAEGDKAK